MTVVYVKHPPQDGVPFSESKNTFLKGTRIYINILEQLKSTQEAYIVINRINLEEEQYEDRDELEMSILVE